MSKRALRLGAQNHIDEGVWFYVHYQPHGMIYWPEEEDAEIRQMLKIPEEDEMPQICVRRWGVPERNEYVREKVRRFQRKTGRVPPEALESITREATAHTILTDWKGIEGEDGKPLKYSQDVALKVLAAHPDFEDVVVTASRDEQAFRDEALEEEGEALGNDSGGSSGGGRTSKGSKTQD